MGSSLSQASKNLEILYVFSNVDERVTYIVVSRDEYSKSATIKNYKTRLGDKKMPRVVRIEWLIDCMINGKIQELTPNYLIDVSKI